MKYARQVQGALERLDQSLLALNKMIKAGKQSEAIEFMEHGALKDSYEDLQSIVKISSVNELGARGTTQTGTF